MSTGTNLQMFIGGNLSSGNRLEIFLDNRLAGGVTNVNGTGNNITMDAGFNAHRYLSLNISGGTMFVDAAVWTGSTWNFQFLGSSTGGVWSPSGTPVLGFSYSYNGSNTAGVPGGTSSTISTALSNAVTTGHEFSIPFSWIGTGVDFTTQVRVAGWVTNFNRNFMSNQFIGGFATPSTQDNLGSDDSAINLGGFQGTQWVQVPTPGAAVLMGLGGLAMARRRR
jgi:hypothetical protein